MTEPERIFPKFSDLYKIFAHDSCIQDNYRLLVHFQVVLSLRCDYHYLESVDWVVTVVYYASSTIGIVQRVLPSEVLAFPILVLIFVVSRVGVLYVVVERVLGWFLPVWVGLGTSVCR